MANCFLIQCKIIDFLHFGVQNVPSIMEVMMILYDIYFKIFK